MAAAELKLEPQHRNILECPLLASAFDGAEIGFGSRPAVTSHGLVRLPPRGQLARDQRELANGALKSEVQHPLKSTR